MEARLADGRDVLVYFNNDYEGYAVKNAQELLGGRKGGAGAGAAGSRSKAKVY